MILSKPIPGHSRQQNEKENKSSCAYDCKRMRRGKYFMNTTASSTPHLGHYRKKKAAKPSLVNSIFKIGNNR